MFRDRYASVFDGDEFWQSVEVAGGETFAWKRDSTYVLEPPFFQGMGAEPTAVGDITGARVLACSATASHRSHLASRVDRADTPAGRYLADHGVARGDFNSYGARRGNHES